MKKNSIFLFFNALSLLLSLSFSACSSDDDENYNENLPKKVCTNSNSQYDAQGRLISSSSYKVTYYQDSIVVNSASTADHEFVYIFYLNEKGLIDKYMMSHYNAALKLGDTYEYNDQNQMCKRGSFECVWKDGNLIQIKDTTNGEIIQSYKYSDQEYIGNVAEFIGYPDIPSSWCTFLWDYGYFGKRCKNLCIEADFPSLNMRYFYEYTLDDEGYVSKIKRSYIHTSNGYQGPTSYINLSYQYL